MVYDFARATAALGVKEEDYYTGRLRAVGPRLRGDSLA